MLAVLASDALALLAAFDSGLEALAVLLHAEGALAVAAALKRLSVLRLRQSVLAVESRRVEARSTMMMIRCLALALKSHFLSLRFDYRVLARVTRALGHAHQIRCKALAVEFQTLRALAVARPPCSLARNLLASLAFSRKLNELRLYFSQNAKGLLLL